ncbi:MAG: Ppx/GppA family phosphatase [Pseudomonadota bacterium]
MTLAAAKSSQIAVIDIGSNSVRLVIYSVSGRAVLPHYNERVMAGLGVGISETGRLSKEGREKALRALRRFGAILDGLAIDQIRAVATAAVRTAEDGTDFLEQAATALGDTIEILSGKDEARLSAKGVAEGLHQADGLVGDLGGSSLEFAEIKSGEVVAGESHLLGPLVFSNKERSPKKVRGRIADTLRSSELLRDRGGRLYLVGGAWRALAKLHMDLTDYPLQQLHAYRMDGRAVTMIYEASQSSDPVVRERLAKASQRRLEVLPYAGLALSETFRIGGFEDVVVSSHGLREGIIFDALGRVDRDRDHLLDAIALYLGLDPRQRRFGETLFDWLLPAIRPPKDLFGSRLVETRIIAAACLFADSGSRFHPDHRAEMAYEHALRGPFANITHLERAFLAFATGARYARGFDVRKSLQPLLDKPYEKLARQLGAVMRLGAVYSGRSAEVLETCGLDIGDGKLALKVAPGQRAMVSNAVERRLSVAANLLDLEPIVINLDESQKA